MLVHGQNVTKAAFERSFSVNRGAARRLEDKLHDIGTTANDVRSSCNKACHLRGRRLAAIHKGRPKIAHDVELIGADRREESLRAPDGVLNKHIVALCFAWFNPFPSVYRRAGFSAARAIRASSAW